MLSKPIMKPAMISAHNQAIEGISMPNIPELINMAATITAVSSQCGELSIFPNKKPMMQAAENSSQNLEDLTMVNTVTQKNCT